MRALKSRLPKGGGTAARYIAEGKSADNIAVTEFLSPESTDLTRGRYIKTGAIYRCVLYYPVGRIQKRRYLPAGRVLLINAGDGRYRYPIPVPSAQRAGGARLGQQLRINRSKIRVEANWDTKHRF